MVGVRTYAHAEAWDTCESENDSNGARRKVDKERDDTWVGALGGGSLVAVSQTVEGVWVVNRGSCE